MLGFLNWNFVSLYFSMISLMQQQPAHSWGLVRRPDSQGLRFASRNICFVFRVWDGVKVCKICLRPVPILNIHVKVVYRVVRFFETHFWTFTWWLCTLFVKVVWALFWIFSLGGCAQRRESLMRLKIVCWSLYLMGGSIREHFHWPWFCQQGSYKEQFFL